MSNPPAILYDQVDSRSCDTVASELRLAGIAHFDDDMQQTLIPPRDIPSGEDYTAYCGGRFRFKKQNSADTLFVGDAVVFDTSGYIGGNGALYVYQQTNPGDVYGYAELNPAQSLVSSASQRTPEQFAVANHGLASISGFEPVCIDLESGSPTYNAYVLAVHPLVGAGERNDPEKRQVVFFATGIVDDDTLRGWHVAHTTSLGEQTVSGASYTPDSLGWLQDNGSVGPNTGTHLVRLCRYNTTTSFDFYYHIVTEGAASGDTPAAGGYRWESAEYDLDADILPNTDIDLNASTASFTTLRDAGTAYLMHSTTNAYQSEWKVIIDGQDLAQADFSVIDGDTIRILRFIPRTTTSELIVWTQVAQ